MLTFWRRIANPSLMFAFSSLGRALGYILPVPVIHQLLGTKMVAFWMAIITILSIQNLFFLGLPQIIVRTLAHGFAASKSKGTLLGSEKSQEFIDGAVFLKVSFSVISAAHVLILASVGSLVLGRLISLLDEPVQGWLAWAVVVAFSIVRVQILRQLTFLNGVGDVSFPRMLDGLSWCLSGTLAAIVLWFTKSIFAMAIATNILNLVCSGLLEARCRKYDWQFMTKKPNWSRLRRTTQLLWGPAWRTGLATLIAALTRQGMGLVFAQTGQPIEVAAYLLTINAMSVANLLSVAPIMSRVHSFVSAFAARDNITHTKLLYSAIKESQTIVVLFCGFGGLFAFPILFLTGFDKLIVSPEMWFVMSLTMLLQRFASAHLQSYSVTNDIIWHWLDGSTGVLTIALCFFLIPSLGLWGIILSGFVAIVLCYSWVPSVYSYKLLHLKFPSRDIIFLATSIATLLLLFLITAAALKFLQN